MRFPAFEIRSGETILCQLHSNHSWYAVAWKIISWVLGISLLSFMAYSFFYQSSISLLLGFLPLKLALVGTQVLCLGLVPLLITAWAIEDIARMFTGIYILTDQRLWIRGSPFAWNQAEIPLDDIKYMSYRNNAIFFRQRSTSKLQVLMVSGGKLLVDVYDKIRAG